MESRHPLVSARFALAATALLGAFGCADEGPVDTVTPPPFVARSEGQVLVALQKAYAERDLDRFSELIAIEDGAAYEFHFPDGSWDAVDELRIHRRLWETENVPPGEAPPPACAWLLRLVPTFEPESSGWTERPELYRSESNPEGLDPRRWRATGASARSDCLVESVTETDYRIQSQSEFVVVEDRAKPLGAERKFLFYRWVDLDGTWKSLKTMCL